MFCKKQIFHFQGTKNLLHSQWISVKSEAWAALCCCQAESGFDGSVPGWLNVHHLMEAELPPQLLSLTAPVNHDAATTTRRQTASLWRNVLWQGQTDNPCKEQHSHSSLSICGKRHISFQFCGWVFRLIGVCVSFSFIHLFIFLSLFLTFSAPILSDHSPPPRFPFSSQPLMDTTRKTPKIHLGDFSFSLFPLYRCCLLSFFTPHSTLWPFYLALQLYSFCLWGHQQKTSLEFAENLIIAFGPVSPCKEMLFNLTWFQSNFTWTMSGFALSFSFLICALNRQHCKQLLCVSCMEMSPNAVTLQKTLLKLPEHKEAPPSFCSFNDIFVFWRKIYATFFLIFCHDLKVQWLLDRK